MDEHSYFTSQSIDLTSDDSSNSELFNEIKGKISDENEVVNPVISKFSKMLLESFERSAMDKSLLKFLKNFASSHKEVEDDIEQFQIVEEETREATVIVDSEIIDLDLMEFADGEDIKKEPETEDIKKEVEESVSDISVKLEIGTEQIQEAMEMETSVNESEQMQVDPTVEETEKTDEPEKKSEFAEKSPGSDAVSDTFEFSEEVTIETAYEPQTSEPPDQMDVESPEFELLEGLNEESLRIEEESTDLRKQLAEIGELIGIQEELRKSAENSGETAEKSKEPGTGEPETEGETNEPSNEEPRSDKPADTSEEKTKLVKVRVFGEQLLEDVKKTDEKLTDPEEVSVDNFIKDSFKKFRELLIEMNLKKYKKRDIEKIKNDLMASGSESSNSEEDSEATESDDDYVLNLDREFQNKNSEPSTPVVVSSTKEDANSPEGAEDNTPEETTAEGASRRKQPESEEESEAGEESETDSSDMDKEIDRLIDFTKLDKIPTENQYVYAGRSKSKKKKKDKIKDILDDTLRDDPSSSESEKDEEMTEEQYLKQINDNIKASLLQSSASESEIESDLDDLDDEEELNEESSDTESLFMKKLHELDKEDEKKIKSRGKEMYEQDDDDDYEDDERVMPEIDSTENKEDDENEIGGKKGEAEKEAEKSRERELENENNQEIQIDQENERNLETSMEQEPKNDQETDKTEKNLEKDEAKSGESSKDPEPEKSKKLLPKVDSLERELFSKKLLEDSDDESSEKEPKEKTARKTGEKRAAGSKDAGSDSSDLEVLDISMFEKKRTYKGTSMEEYFSKKDPLTDQNQPSTSSAASAKPTPPEDEAISLSSDSEDESVSSATPSASSSATANKKRGPRSLLTTEQLAEETKKAQKDEDGRVRRLDAKIEMLSQVLSQSEELLTQEDSTLILDFDKKRQKPITVHPELVKLLKEHQVEGELIFRDFFF